LTQSSLPLLFVDATQDVEPLCAEARFWMPVGPQLEPLDELRGQAARARENAQVRSSGFHLEAATLRHRPNLWAVELGLLVRLGAVSECGVLERQLRQRMRHVGELDDHSTTRPEQPARIVEGTLRVGNMREYSYHQDDLEQLACQQGGVIDIPEDQAKGQLCGSCTLSRKFKHSPSGVDEDDHLDVGKKTHAQPAVAAAEIKGRATAAAI
jgi:hypothetical protein